MVTASVRSSAAGVQDALEDREVMGIGALALLGAGGVFLGQEFADQVMPMLDRPVDPTSATDLFVSAGLKLAGAVVLGIVALQLGTTASAAAGVVSFGVLVSMGLDLIDAVQRGGLPGNAPSPSRSPSTGPKRVSPSTSSQSPSTGSSGKVTRTAQAGGSSRGSPFR